MKLLEEIVIYLYSAPPCQKILNRRGRRSVKTKGSGRKSHFLKLASIFRPCGILALLGINLFKSYYELVSSLKFVLLFFLEFINTGLSLFFCALENLYLLFISIWM